METTIIGLISAIIIGFSLGMVGGGGSILTVPALVYLLGVNPVLATAYSLFIVGLTSLVGSVSFMKRGLVSYQTALVFAIPSLTAVFLTRKYIIPWIPVDIMHIGEFAVTKDIMIMVVFAIVMLVAGISMVKSGKNQEEKHPEFKTSNYIYIVLEGLLVGTVTGLVGAGGGFLIIPALVLLAKLPMKLAVGTSLLIIAAKSLIGFIGDITEQVIDWNFLILFSGFAIVGIFFGSFISKYVDAYKLKVGFGWMVLLMSAFILVQELM